MNTSKVKTGSRPGDEHLKMYQAWKMKLPQLQSEIVDPSISDSTLRDLRFRIQNLKAGIEDFEKQFPAYAIKDHTNSKVIQKSYSQGLLF